MSYGLIGLSSQSAMAYSHLPHELNFLDIMNIDSSVDKLKLLKGVLGRELNYGMFLVAHHTCHRLMFGSIIICNVDDWGSRYFPERLLQRLFVGVIGLVNSRRTTWLSQRHTNEMK